MIPIRQVPPAELPSNVKTFTIGNNNSKTFTVSSASRCVFQAFGLEAGMFHFQVYARSNGTISMGEVYKGSSVTWTRDTNSLTITNGSSGAVTVYVTIFSGDVS